MVHPDVGLDVDGMVVLDRHVHRHEGACTSSSPETSNGRPVQDRHSANEPGTFIEAGQTLTIRAPIRTWTRNQGSASMTICTAAD